jgi:hypothetical protein
MSGPMSNFSHHEECPECGSADNLGVWEDGHKWCFGCHYYIPASALSIKNMEQAFESKQESKLESLPYDVTTNIPKEPYGWLKKYSLTNEEIVNNNLLWSSSAQMLIFPYYGDMDKTHENSNEIIFWQGRYFPTRKPKVYTGGDINHITILSSTGSNHNNIVVVEDPVSAIKVSRVVDCCPLFGSHLSMHKVTKLSRYYDNLILWLDQDKTKEMIKFAERYKFLFKNVKIVSTEKDPKEYSTEEITNFINS